MHEIRKGLERKLDISWYAKPEFEAEQMRQIREGLELGLDVSLYVRPEFDFRQMEQIKFSCFVP